MNRMNREVFLSILALDAYNRGYGQNVGELMAEGQIGTANILADALSDLDIDDVLAAGFYAIAYNWNGERVISFRGTNFVSDISDIPQLLGTYADISEGWSIFTGWGGSRNAAGLPAG